MVSREGALQLLRRRDFRRTYLAMAVSELGDAFQYIALMWFALEAGGPLGVLVVRLADSVPALLFGLHGGVVADRLDRRRTMNAADLVRGAVLVPIAAAGLAGELPLAALVAAAFVITAATSYFDPAYGALLPALVDRRNVQTANGAVRAAQETLSVTGWALAAALLAVMPLSAFFALNAASYFLSAALLLGVHTSSGVEPTEPPRVAEGIAVLRPLPALAAGVSVLRHGGIRRDSPRRRGTCRRRAGGRLDPPQLAAQEQVPDRFLGRVMGLIALVHRGAHATGLLFVAPLFAVVDTGPVFAAAAVAIPVTALTGLAFATRRAGEARATA